MEEWGTRQRTGQYYSRPETRFPNNKYTSDVGLSKRVTIAGVFAGSLISDNAGTTDFSVFKADDSIIIWGSASNNGVRTVVSISSGSITVDWPLVTEGPTSGVEVRTT